MKELTLIDTHAHYYDFCDFETYFDYAFLNMKAAANEMNASSYTLILCLLETENSHWNEKLGSIAATSGKLGKWSIQPVDNNQVLLISKGPNESLMIVPGRQVITAESLEVIIIGKTENILYRKPVDYYVEKYGLSYLVVIPWGVGKWLGKRGSRVNQLLKETNLPFVLGDNSGRPWIWSNIPQFKRAKKLGKGILAGSDPLPVFGQFKKVATYGSVTNGKIQGQDICKQIRTRLLVADPSSVETYGKVNGVFTFIANQLLLRVNPLS